MPQTFLQYLAEQYALMEGLQHVVKSNPDIPEETIKNYHSNVLPEDNKSDKLLNHVLKMHRLGNITPENTAELKQHLHVISKANMIGKMKDKFSVPELAELTKNHDTPTTPQEKDAATPIIHDNDHIRIEQHLTHESAVKGASLDKENEFNKKRGGDARATWCVSSNSVEGKRHFTSYTNKGEHPLYTIYNKDTHEKHALVANPNKNLSNFELRDESDANPYRDSTSLLHFMLRHKGIEHTAPGKYLHSLMDEPTKKIAAQLFDPSKLTDPDKSALINHPDQRIRNAAYEHVPLSRNDIHNVIARGNVESIKSVMKNRNVGEEHISEALNHKDKQVRLAAIQSPKATEYNIDEALRDPDQDVQIAAVRHKNVTPGNIDTAIDHAKSDFNGEDDNFKAAKIAAKHPKATSENIFNALKSDVDGVQVEAAKNPNLTSRHIDHILKNSPDLVARYAMQSPHISEENAKDALFTNRWPLMGAITSARRNPALPQHMIEKLYENPSTHADLALNPSTPKHLMDKLISHPLDDVRYNASKNPKLTSGQLDKLLNDTHREVRISAIQHPNTTSAQLSRQLVRHSDDPEIVEHVIRHPNAPYKKLLEMHVNPATDSTVKKSILKRVAMNLDDANLSKYNKLRSPHATEEDLREGMKSEDPWIRHAAVSNPKMDKFILTGSDSNSSSQFSQYLKDMVANDDDYMDYGDHSADNAGLYSHFKPAKGSDPYVVHAAMMHHDNPYAAHATNHSIDKELIKSFIDHPASYKQIRHSGLLSGLSKPDLQRYLSNPMHSKKNIETYILDNKYDYSDHEDVINAIRELHSKGHYRT